ncbi:type II toxin-antitoxin system RelE/ParE family toxin [Microbispora bryophytorum]|uniref:Addiction module toxin RelE n=1 Tax=Microbispora bryophytorum TaxID=1460882 RepID=A0A8H9L9I5_9ACTN|nr:type II toxin-antitoxin system RelE/ParE family toxin [Microbispora bryophytorum]GGO01171.1 hypothetical protein GCM10011574_08700 [Microbispora bryophytorum]
MIRATAPRPADPITRYQPAKLTLALTCAAWFEALAEEDWDSAEQVEDAIDMLAEAGPALGRPLVDRIKGAELHHLKELRPGSAGGSEIRILFAFDPVRRAVLLVAGDKAGNWQKWYDVNIPQAEKRYEAHLIELEIREYE